MQKLIKVAEAEKKLPQLLKDVEENKVRYILMDNKKYRAVIIPYETYLKWSEPEKQEALARFDKIREEIGEKNAHIPEEEVEADLEMVTKALRERRRNESGSY
ncbi:MAG: type II toxin-antitoxin system Phd/YefM family antitoxin [Chloroflexota bacterium]